MLGSESTASMAEEDSISLKALKNKAESVVLPTPPLPLKPITLVSPEVIFLASVSSSGSFFCEGSIIS